MLQAGGRASWTASPAGVIHPQRDAVSGELTRQKKGGPRRQRVQEAVAAACQEAFQLSPQERREETELELRTQDSQAGQLGAASGCDPAPCGGPQVPACTGGQGTTISTVPPSRRGAGWTCPPPRGAEGGELVLRPLLPQPSLALAG